MSLLAVNAHTGEQYPAPPSSNSSLESFKSWLAKQSSVAVADQVLFTSTGKQVKQQNLSGENEIYLYNRQLIAASSSSSSRLSLANQSISTSTLPSPPPSSDPHSDDIQAWRQLFDARSHWGQDLSQDSTATAEDITRHCDAIQYIRRGLDLAVANLQVHVRSLETKYGQATEWVKSTSTDQDDVLHAVETAFAQMEQLPANKEFLRLLPRLEEILGDVPHSGRLKDFANVKIVNERTRAVRMARESILQQMNAFEQGMKEVSDGRDDIENSSEQVGSRSDADAAQAAADLMHEIEVLVRKLTSDSEHVATLQASQRSSTQISKMAQLHTKQYLPNLGEYYDELRGIFDRVKQDHEEAAQASLQIMQAIARTEASLHQHNKQLNSLSISEEAEAAFDYLTVLGQLPFVYGALLVEAVRRREWSTRLKAESAELAEDIAGHREEEEKRRKRWMKNIGHLITQEAGTGSVLEFELNLSTDQQLWPNASREDIQDYIGALKQLSGVDEIIEELSESLKDLDRPTKRQMKKAKGAFKNGSIHEAVSGKGSFLMRESDEVRVLKEMNTKLEEDVKGQKSRVRRLEDLLYQQQQRPSSGNIFAPGDDRRRSSITPDIEPPSPATDITSSRKTSIASRRTSATKSAEEKSLARRLLGLEAELQEERSKLAAERQKHAEEDRLRAEDEHRIRTEIAEGNSTKKDLMENMEAQQREFAEERRMLQNEAKEHRLKVEEMEEEFDRVLGSRDNERNVSDRRLQEALGNMADLEGERAARDEAQAEHTTALQNIRANFGAETPAPSSLADLLRDLEDLSARSLRKTDDLKQTIASIKADKASLQEDHNKQQTDLTAQRSQNESLEAEINGLRNEYDAEKAKTSSISTELQDARTQLKNLRSKFAEGETGSEVLRTRLEEQATKAGNLASKLAETKSHVNSLDFELSSLQRRHQKLQAEAETSSIRLTQRSQKDRELTHALVNTQDALVHLLQDLGLSVFSRDGALAIQRTSKLVNASSSGLADSVQLPVPTSVDLRPDSMQLQWMHAITSEEESRLFSELISKLSALDISTFYEAIIKLRRDIEWTGKKWKHESRVYREKYQRANNEGSEKIAFRAFKEGDLALFLPTRNQATRPWAAFNVGAPHYFLREQDSHRLQHREWLVARISKVEERIVDLSKSSTGPKVKGNDAASIKSTGGESAISFDDDNPFELSDGLRWYLLDAAEERPSPTGAPSTPGLGKSTVASANVDAKGSVRMKRSPKDQTDRDVSKMLNKSLDTDRNRSRRSSTSSKRASISAIPEETAQALQAAGRARPGSRSSANAPAVEPSEGLAINIGRTPSHEKVPDPHDVSVSRANLLFGP